MRFFFKKEPAVFIDRDGTINDKIEEVKYSKDFKLLPNTIKALKLLQQKTNYKLIIITNQIGIGRGNISIEDYNKVNAKMMKLFSKNNIKIDAVYFCPHKIHENCNCRKPKTGLFKQAKKDFNLNFKKSWMIGDKTSDIKVGKNIKCKTILVKTGAAGKDNKYNVKPIHIVNDLYDAAKLIVKNS